MITRGVGHILTWMNIMHYSPMAVEKFDAVLGEDDPSDEALLASLLDDVVPEIPGGKIEVHSLEVMNQIKDFLTGVTFTKEMVTFFNDKLSFVDADDDESDGDGEGSAAYTVENNDASDALPDVPEASPDTSRDGLLVPGVLPGTSSEPSPKPSPKSSPKLSPGASLEASPGIPPNVPAEALSVPETPTHYDDVIVGKTGPFNLSDLQDIREDEQEDETL